MCIVMGEMLRGFICIKILNMHNVEQILPTIFPQGLLICFFGLPDGVDNYLLSAHTVQALAVLLTSKGFSLATFAEHMPRDILCCLTCVWDSRIITRVHWCALMWRLWEVSEKMALFPPGL